MILTRTLAALLGATLLSVHAATAAPDYEHLKRVLVDKVPGQQPDSIRPSPLPGIAEVVYGPRLFYVSEDGKYLLSGNIIDLVARRDLTEDRQSELRRAEVNALGEEQMIVFSPKEVKHTITVFTDIDCTYCRKMHQHIDEFLRAGVRVRYLMFPRTGLSGASYDKAVAVWCAKDRNAALTRAKAGEAVEMKQCANPIKTHFELGERVGVSATPAWMSEDGHLETGYIEPERLTAVLAEWAKRDGG